MRKGCALRMAETKILVTMTVTLPEDRVDSNSLGKILFI